MSAPTTTDRAATTEPATKATAEQAFRTAADPHAPAIRLGRSALVDGFMV